VQKKFQIQRQLDLPEYSWLGIAASGSQPPQTDLLNLFIIAEQPALLMSSG